MITFPHDTVLSRAGCWKDTRDIKHTSPVPQGAFMSISPKFCKRFTVLLKINSQHLLLITCVRKEEIFLCPAENVHLRLELEPTCQDSNMAKTHGLPTEITHLVSGLNETQVLDVSWQKEFSERQSDG